MNTSVDKNKLRCFLGMGFSLAKEVRSLQQTLGHIATEPRSKLRVVDESNLHLTLKFLGATNDEQIPKLVKSLSALHFESAPLHIHCRGVGFFNNSIWLGVERDNSLSELAMLLDKQCAMLGFKQERKPFLPHITVARFSKNAKFDMSRIMSAFSDTDWGMYTAEEFNLYRSETLPTGARYSVIESFPLA